MSYNSEDSDEEDSHHDDEGVELFRDTPSLAMEAFPQYQRNFARIQYDPETQVPETETVTEDEDMEDVDW